MVVMHKSKVKSEEYISSVINEIQQWIDANLSERITVDAVAQRAGYSKWYFQRLFHHVTGFTVAKYICSRRMSMASELLIRTDMKINDVVMEVGYDSPSVFIRAFKRYFSTAPGDYRKNYLQKIDSLN